MTVHGIKEGLS